MVLCVARVDILGSVRKASLPGAVWSTTLEHHRHARAPLRAAPRRHMARRITTSLHDKT